jgi:DNA-directed RNA polymerase specialized sigma24 family protein
MDDEAIQAGSDQLVVEPWELDLVRMAAARIRTTDREELVSELTLHLLHVKREHKSRVRHWRAYLKASLHNRAVNWIRDRQRQQAGVIELDAAGGEEEPRMTANLLGSSEPGPDNRVAFGAAWDALGPNLQNLWEALIQENGNQTRVAKRLKLHRNTVRLWIRRIQDVMKTHGF